MEMPFIAIWMLYIYETDLSLYARCDTYNPLVINYLQNKPVKSG